MEHEIARQHGPYHLCSRLCVDGVRHVAKIFEHVVAVDHEEKAPLDNLVCQACVPYEIVGVEGIVGEPPAVVDREIGRELEIAGQVEYRPESRPESPGVLVGEIVYVRREMAVASVETCEYGLTAEIC